jgi:hypothetical protein
MPLLPIIDPNGEFSVSMGGIVIGWLFQAVSRLKLYLFGYICPMAIIHRPANVTVLPYLICEDG